MATGTVGFEFRVTATGPIFDGRLRREVRNALRDTVQDLVERGEQMVKRQLYPGHGLISGDLKRSVSGVVTGDRAGLIDTPIIYGPWVEGVSRRNEVTRFKGYHMFRNTSQALNKSKRRLLEQHLQRALR